MPIPPRVAAYVAVVALIFFLGYRAASFIWSARYEAQRRDYAELVEDQRARHAAESLRIAKAAADREAELLKSLDARRTEYELLSEQIDLAPVILPERVVVEQGPARRCGPRVDWSAFGRLYDHPAATGQAAENPSAAVSGDPGAPATDARR